MGQARPTIMSSGLSMAPMTTPSCSQAPGAYWGHAPDHRDNPQRDPRHIACFHGCGQDCRNAQDVSHHRADRDGRHHHRVARGQAPSPRLARRSRGGHPMPATARPYLAGPQTPGSRLGSLLRNRLSEGGLSEAITGPGMSISTKDTHPAVMTTAVPASGPAWPWRRSPRSPALSRAATRLAGTTGRSLAGSARCDACSTGQIAPRRHRLTPALRVHLSRNAPADY